VVAIALALDRGPKTSKRKAVVGELKSVAGCVVMPLPVVQIYEVQDPLQAEALAAMGVDRIGSVILHRRRWRLTGIEETIRICRRRGASASLIPLFRDREGVLAVLDHYRPHIVHFCEALSPFPDGRDEALRLCDDLLELQMAVRTFFPDIRICRSLSLPRPGSGREEEVLGQILEYLRLFAPLSDEFLLDTYLGGFTDGDSQPVTGFVGITGETLDWEIAARLVAASPRPVILAGGLSADNVFAAVMKVRPYGVDSCTRTNAVDEGGTPIRFRKDLEKVRRFLAAARRAGEALGL